MILDFIKIQFLSVYRNLSFEEFLLSKLFKIFSILGGIIFLIFVSFFQDKLFLDIYPNLLPLDTFSFIFPFFFVFDFILKLITKSSKSADFYPYLTLPIKRKRLFHYTFIKEALSIYNLYAYIIILPFLFKTFFPEHGLSRTILFASFFYIGSLINSILIGYFKTIAKKTFWKIIYPFLLLLLMIYGAWLIIISDELIVDISQFFSIYSWQAFFLMLFSIVGLIEIFSFWSRQELYDSLNNNGSKRRFAVNLHFLDKIGLIGEFYKLYIRIILRSNIFRWNIIFFPILFVIGLFSLAHGGNIMDIPFVIRTFYIQLMIGLIGFQFSMMFSLESSFFDVLISSQKEAPFKILKYKYYFCVSITFFIASILILFLGDLPFIFLISSFFYVIGPIFFILFQNAVYNKIRVDLFANIFNMNRSNSLASSIVMIACFSFVIITCVIALYTSEDMACYFMLTIGIIVFALHPIWLRNIHNRFMKQRYKNMDNFRNFN